MVSGFVHLVPDHVNMKEVKLVIVAVQIAKVTDLRATQTVLFLECVPVGRS
jgi:hypothetical protein